MGITLEGRTAALVDMSTSRGARARVVRSTPRPRTAPSVHAAARVYHCTLSCNNASHPCSWSSWRPALHESPRQAGVHQPAGGCGGARTGRRSGGGGERAARQGGRAAGASVQCHTSVMSGASGA